MRPLKSTFGVFSYQFSAGTDRNCLRQTKNTQFSHINWSLKAPERAQLLDYCIVAIYKFLCIIEQMLRYCIVFLWSYNFYGCSFFVFACWPVHPCKLSHLVRQVDPISFGLS